jgi:TolB-like protein/Tfp pilus assembly protein PilF
MIWPPIRYRREGRLNYTFDECVLDVDRRELSRGGALIPVEPRAFDLLAFLIANRDRVLSKDELIAEIWHGRFVSDSAVTTTINAVRLAIGDSGINQRLIKTLPRKGWRFVANVTPDALPGDAAAAAGAEAPHLSIVILPFNAMSRGEAEEAFADGLTDILTTDLSRLMPGLFVISCQSAFVYKSARKDMREIGRELGVKYALEGSVQRHDRRMRINAQLIDTGSGAHVWAERFDYAQGDLFDLQDELAARISNALSVPLVARAAREAEKRSADPHVVDLMLRAHAIFLDAPVLPRHLDAAERLYQQVLSIDPSHAGAKAGLADVLVSRASDWRYNLGLTDEACDRMVGKAEALVQEVLDSGRSVSSAAHSLSLIHIMRDRWDEAERYARISLEQNENRSAFAIRLGYVLSKVGRPDEAVAYFLEAIRRSPHDPHLVALYDNLGWAHLLLGSFEDAVAWLEKSRALRPTFAKVHFNLAAAYGQLGRIADAKSSFAEGLRLAPTVDRIGVAAQRHFPTARFRELFERHIDAGMRKAGLDDDLRIHLLAMQPT